MRRDSLILLLILLQGGVFSEAFGQSDKFAYAVTDVKKDGANWTVLRKVDIKSGQFSDVIMDGGANRRTLYASSNKEPYLNSIRDTFKLFQPDIAFGSGVAALAYDRRNERLFFTPMYVDQLRYVDIATQKVYCVGTKGFSGTSGAKLDGTGTISRMVIAGDGNGYTLSNDGDHLYRFTTSGDPLLTDLGALTDAAVNTNSSIHSFCSNAGGDMIADNGGNLLLITASNHVFRIGITDKIATFLGTIKGLPEKFTTNGAAVDDEGKVLLSSSTYSDSWYTVDPKNWTATPYHSPDGVYHSSDLANSNVLSTNNQSSTSTALNLNGASMIKLYPNPVENNQFTVRFTNLVAGEYNLQLMDQLGRQLLERKVTILSSSHSENIKLQNNMAKGVYMVKVINRQNQQVFVEKLMVSRLL